MAVPVNIYVSSDEVIPTPISGVVVSAYDASLNLMSQVITDAAGVAAMLLPGTPEPGTSYEVRFFKMGVVFGGARRISVVEPATLPNAFSVAGTLTTLPTALDPRVCRCTGRFLNFANQPIAGATIRVASKAESGLEIPKVVDSNMITGEVMTVTTNSEGYATIDLHRGGEYYVSFSGNNDRVWNFKVPDRASVNLIDLIHPQPVLLAWDPTVAPGAAISLNVGEAVVVPATLLFSDFELLNKGLNAWVLLTSSDSTKVRVEFGQEHAVVLAVEPGSAQVTASCRKGISPSRVPEYSIAAAPLVVTVTSPP